MEKIRDYRSLDNIDVITSTERYWINYETHRRLEIQSGNSAFIFGYSDEELTTAIHDTNVMFVRAGTNETDLKTERVANSLLDYSEMQGISWAVSGSDGVEAAIAMSDMYWKMTGKEKPLLVTFNPGYHGTTYLLKGTRNEEIVERCVVIDAPIWTNLDDRHNLEKQTVAQLENLLNNNKKIGAIMCESIPWFNGVLPYSNYWWAEIRRLCDTHDVNFIIDDVAGFGKLGELFGHIAVGAKPDVVAIGKALTGGYSPLSAALCNDKIYTQLRKSWDHTHTWNPNAHGISAASAIIAKANRGDFKKAIEINQRMQKIADRLPCSYRSHGLFFELISDKHVSNHIVLNSGLSYNIAVSDNSLILVLPLIADDEYFDHLEKSLAKAFNEF